MTYKLKIGQESFEIMSGPDEGKKFTRGKGYAPVPEGYQDRFEEIKTEGGRPKAEGKSPSTAKKKADAPAVIRPWDAEEKTITNDE